MSVVIAAPEMMTSAATDLGTIGSNVSAAHMAAVSPTVGLVPAAGDEVSAGVAQLFSRYAQDFQGLAGRAAVFHEEFVQHLTAGAHSYGSAEAVNASWLQLLNASSGASANAIAASPAVSLNSLGQNLTFVHDLGILLHDLILVPINFFFFLIHSGVPFALFGIVIFPGF